MTRVFATTRSVSERRAMVLLSVILVITIAALAGTTAMYLAQAQMSSTRTTLKRTQARSMAWSGVQAAMAEIADQRDKLLDGGAPELTAKWELFSDEGGSRGVVRLIASKEDGPIAESEAAKLDLNSATVDMLKAAGLDAKTASSIVSARDSRRFLSERDVLRLPGVTLGSGQMERDAASGPMEPETGPKSAGERLLRQWTVFVFDPNIQSGLGTNGSDYRGKRRVNLNTPWSDRLASAVDERFGQGASTALKSFFDKGTKFKSLADVVQATRTTITDPNAWPPVFDALTVSQDPYLLGRVDLNRAPAAILACVPGISKDAAEKIQEVRDSLDVEARKSIVWPVAQGILKAEDFQKAADWLTTRSMQWRVRVEAGTTSADAEVDEGTVKLKDRVVLEAVIDVASERPRVAYLRDVTIEDVAEKFAARAQETAEANEADAGATRASREPPPVAVPADDDVLKLDTDLDLSTSMDKGFGDLKLGSPPAPAAKPPERKSAKPDAGPTETPPSEPPPDEGVDRRIGRWTTGKGGKGGPP